MNTVPSFAPRRGLVPLAVHRGERGMLGRPEALPVIGELRDVLGSVGGLGYDLR